MMLNGLDFGGESRNMTDARKVLCEADIEAYWASWVSVVLWRRQGLAQPQSCDLPSSPQYFLHFLQAYLIVLEFSSFAVYLIKGCPFLLFIT